MRHRKDGRRLGRNSSHRRAMMRNLVTALLEHGKITTTEARAKELRRVAEKMITLGKKALRSSFPEELSAKEYQQKYLHLFRQALSFLQDKGVAHKVFQEYAPALEERAGGYTRIIKLPPRQGDNAPVAIIELVHLAGVPAQTETAGE
ncbi:MAG: 50S ribosomal protein L17 [Myxococcales bacterium]|nr:50S ribosomal protein L17 [Myxococcales bacterium]